MDVSEMFGENSGVVLLQLIIIILALVIIVLIFMDRSNVYKLESKIDDIGCPSCPDCPAAPDCICDGTECPACPACNCPTPSGTDIPGCPECPQCPDVNTSCPTPKTLTIDDITDAIFPGRNKGITSHGQYFPLDGLGEGMVEPAFSPVVNLQPNYVGGDGVPAAISYSDQTVLNNNRMGLATQRRPALASTQGVFSQGSTNSGTTNSKTTNSGTTNSRRRANRNKQTTNDSKSDPTPVSSSNKGLLQNIEDKLENLL